MVSVDTLRLLIKSIVELLWPARCVACRQGSGFACPACLAQIAPAWRRPPVFEHLDRFVACSALSETTEAFVYALKYRGLQDLATPLADRMCDVLALRQTTRALFGTNPLIIPVPLHPTRLRQRSYNQADLLARRIASVAAMPMDATSLARTRATDQQVKQADRGARRDNMKGAFAVIDTATVTGRDIVLIDDVSTTGATLDDCARALKASGARTVSAIVLAHG